MLQSSARAVVTTASALSSAHGLVACYAPKAIAAAAVPASLLLCRRQGGMHQRRFSSSKTSSPKNRQPGPKTLPARDVSSSAESKAASGEAKTPTEKRKRRANKAAEEAAITSDPFLALPSVPNTHHLSQEAVGLTNFFSMHRPISITHSVPKSITDEAFAEIFTSRMQSNPPTEVISTISKVVDNLEGPFAKLTLSPNDESRDGVHKIEIRHEDGSNSNMMFQAKTAGQFLPFQPPPLPVAASAEGEAADVSPGSQDGLDLQPQHRVYQAMFTIEETMDTEGRVHVMAHSPEIMNDGGVRQSRRVRYENALRRRHELNAISVMKRRKAKMKKHKLKKRRKAQRKMRERLHQT